MQRAIFPNFSLKTTPVSIGYFTLLVLAYFGTTATNGEVASKLAFPTTFTQPWGILTFPFAVQGGGGGLASLILTLILTMFFITQVERTMGSMKTLTLWIGCVLAMALFVTIGAKLCEVPWVISSREPVILALFALYVGQFKRTSASILGAGGIQIEIILLIFTVIAYLPYLDLPKGAIFGLFAIAPTGIGYWGSDFFVRSRVGKTADRTRVADKRDLRPDSYFEEARRREKEREERERLRKLFESSLDEGDDR
jgi:membrane associated rhomboid family serine protease